MTDMPAEKAETTRYDEIETAPLVKGTRPALWANAIIAWGGALLTNTLAALGEYENVATGYGLFGSHPSVTSSWYGRLLQQLSYFTMWSNIMVAVVTLVLAINPARRTKWRKGIHLAALIMILVTAIIYATVISPYVRLKGWAVITNPWQHIVTPTVTWLVWLIWGPRDLSGSGVITRCLTVPLAWVVWMSLYGILVQEYPYGFVNVLVLGWASVIRNMLIVLAVSLVICALIVLLDRILRKLVLRTRKRD